MLCVTVDSWTCYTCHLCKQTRSVIAWNFIDYQFPNSTHQACTVYVYCNYQHSISNTKHLNSTWQITMIYKSAYSIAAIVTLACASKHTRTPVKVATAFNFRCKHTVFALSCIFNVVMNESPLWMRPKHLIYNLWHSEALKSTSQDTSYANSDSKVLKQH